MTAIGGGDGGSKGGGGEGGMGADEGGVGEGGGEGGGKGEDDAVARSTGSHCEGQAMTWSSQSRPSARRSGCPPRQAAKGRDFELLEWPMACV